MLRYSRVPEHLDTKSFINSTSSLRHSIEILVKWRPPGRPTNRHIVEGIPPYRTRPRDPVSFGEVEGVFHVSLPRWRDINARSSRRGKEQMRSRTSGEPVRDRWSDLRVGDNPWNRVRETRGSSEPVNSKWRCTIL
jgi:hypothetical protein